MPAGNVFKPRRSLTRQTNPIPQQGRQPSLFQTPGQGNPMQVANSPYSFNPQNQDVLGREAAAQAQSAAAGPAFGTYSMFGRMPTQQQFPMQGRPQSGLADYPQFPQGTGPLRSYGQSGSQMMDQQVQAAGVRSQAQSIRDSAAAIDALRMRSQGGNPMAPYDPATQRNQSAMAASDAGLSDFTDRFTRFQQAAPPAYNSIGAARNAGQAFDQDTSRMSNGYNGQLNNPMLTAEQKFQLAQQNASRLAGGGAAADPTNIGGRFGGAYGAGLSTDAAAIRVGSAVRLADGSVSYFTGTQESARQAQIAGKTEREVLRDRGNMNVPQSELDRRDAADVARRERQGRQNQFREANNGMNYRQMDRLNRQNTLTEKAVREGRLSPESANLRMQNRADTALRRSGNPMLAGTDESRTLFPDMMKGRGGQQSSAPNPMSTLVGPGSPNTVENVNARNEARKANVSSSPTLAAWGVTPDLDPATFAETVGQNLFKPQPNGGFGFADVSDEGLKSIFNQVKLFDPAGDGKPPFPEGSIYNQMWALPENTPLADIRKMFENILNNMNAVPQAPMGQAGRTYGKM